MTATIIQICGLISAVIAGFLLADWLGFAVGAVALLLFGLALERR